MNKPLKVLIAAAAIIWLLIGVLVIYFFIMVKIKGQDSICQAFSKCCQQKEERLKQPLENVKEQTRRDQGVGARLTPQVRACIVGKLGEEKAEEVKELREEGGELDKEVIQQIQECIEETR